jgi:hypothetical protein
MLPIELTGEFSEGWERVAYRSCKWNVLKDLGIEILSEGAH